MENISIPIALDAFTLCLDSCNADAKILIAPITQPSYVGLRLDSSIIQHDVLKPVDLHNTVPIEVNTRLTEVGAPTTTVKFNRLGVYLHWSLPRLYRTATAAADSSKDNPAGPEGRPLTLVPAFKRVPNRWLVIRHLKKAEPVVPQKFTSWIVESDRVRRVDDPELKDADLEVDVTPFVDYDGNDPDPLNTQTEVFLGNKVPARGYKEAPNGRYVPLTIMNSSNPLFPDYTPHNTNVFSIIDNFSYFDSKTNKTSYLTNATANYCVIGWHSSKDSDPLHTENQSLNSRLTDLLLKLNTTGLSQGDSKIGDDFRGLARGICHGAMYDVVYDQKKRTPSTADDSMKNFDGTVKMEPISIGTTPLDGILSFLDAHKNDGQAEKIFGKGGSTLANEVFRLSALMYAANDAYDTRLNAQDLVLRNDYAAAEGGVVWTYAGKSGPGGASAIPTTAEQLTLTALNEVQTRLDAANRQIKSLRWDLFAEWWKFVSDQSNTNPVSLPPYRRRVHIIRDRLENLLKQAEGLNNRINGSKDGKVKPDEDFSKLLKKQATKPPFYTRKDPTLCIAGLESGWPTNFMDNVACRLKRQLEQDSQKLQAADAIFSVTDSPLPEEDDLRDTAQRLLAEFLIKINDENAPLPVGAQSWSGKNPFVPLFVEYELLYYHIEFKKWIVETRTSTFGNASKHVRYSVSNDQPLFTNVDNQKDVRSLSGRVMILPQPVFDLAAMVKQVTSNANKDFPLSQTEIADVLQNIQKLTFISTPMTDITNHLLTRTGGSHVKPNVRLLQGDQLFALQRAIDAADLKSADPLEKLDKKALEDLIQAESALTPYGNLVDFATANNTRIPFKPVTHGQMMFRQLNIVDKFGQAIALPDPRLRKRRDDGAPASLYPCLSDAVSPSLLSNGNLNTIFQEDNVVSDKAPTSRFMELGPSINQDVRLNAAFVAPKLSAGRVTWQPTTDYDLPAGPVWGWIVINYADSGLQFFLGDGTFYREVRKGGVDGTNTSERWLPFDAPPTSGDKGLAQYPQMDALISRMKSGYLQSFFDMINGSIATMPFPPSEYSQFANAIVGKPLALINVGWSIELAAPAIKAQNTLGNTPDDQEWDILRSYKFPVKLGDADRPFDGVVAYWEIANRTDAVDIAFDQTFSYFVSKETDNFKSIAPSNFPKLSPTYVEPDIAGDFVEAVTSNYHITPMLIDPYTPIHGFSPILPIKTLQLPPWCIQSAFKRITAFFRLGPQLVTKDIPRDYSAGTHATPETWLVPPPNDGTPAPIRLPIAGKKGLWKWLQPYQVDGDTKFNSLDVGEEDTRIRSDPAPYTFLEGYLQLARPLLNEDVAQRL